jgi:hypothetical protein
VSLDGSKTSFQRQKFDAELLQTSKKMMPEEIRS